MNDYLGAHMSISGGLHLAIDRAVAAGCGVLQIFTRNSNQWKGKPVSEADAALFREKLAASGLHEIISHDIYLINLAAPPGETRDKSLAAFRDELETCARLGIAKVVMHPGSHLVDSPETGLEDKVVTTRTPTRDELAAMLFAWRVVKHVKSNAIVYAGQDRTLGIGAGQMSRVDASRIAIWKAADAGLSLKGSAVGSDAFFPFPDGLIAAAEAGATCAIQPGGSVRDPEVIAAANERKIAMICTGVRHFKH